MAGKRRFKLSGSRRQSKAIIETDYRNILEDWKARLHLERDRGVHEKFGLSVSKKPGVHPIHTRALELAKYILSYPDPTKGWTPFALEAIQEIRRQNVEIDAIVTTSPPISSHLIGREAKDILGCPWIADLRDLWTQNLGERTSNMLQIGLEKRTLRQADGLVTVSDPWASRLERRYPEKKIWSITNGFDPDDFDSPASAKNSPSLIPVNSTPVSAIPPSCSKCRAISLRMDPFPPASCGSGSTAASKPGSRP